MHLNQRIQHRVFPCKLSHLHIAADKHSYLIHNETLIELLVFTCHHTSGSLATFFFFNVPESASNLMFCHNLLHSILSLRTQLLKNHKLLPGSEEMVWDRIRLSQQLGYSFRLCLKHPKSFVRNLDLGEDFTYEPNAVNTFCITSIAQCIYVGCTLNSRFSVIQLEESLD